MSKHVLVVESRKEVIEDLKDHLLSINHSYDVMTSQIEARECLRKRCTDYSYVILSLDIPVKPERSSKMKFGLNLFSEMQQVYSDGSTPIVVTLNRRDIDADIALKLSHKGAFIAVKPFEENTKFSLERAIFSALDSKPNSVSSLDIESEIKLDQILSEDVPQKKDHVIEESEPATQDDSFAKPEMVFYENRVELCGVTVCGDSSTLTRRLLNLLKERTSEGKYKPYSGYELAVIADCESGQQGISACVSKFRNKVFSLLDGKNIFDLGDIIINDRTHGYCLKECIEVVEILPSKTKRNTPKDSSSDLPDTQQNILKYLRTNQKGSSLELQQNLQISKSVANRHLQELREAGYVICSGKGKSTLWLPVDQY